MNRREKIVYDKSIEEGWEVLSRGYPDFILYKEKTNEAIFVEVKSEQARRKKIAGGELSKEQTRMHEILKNLGFITTIVHI